MRTKTETRTRLVPHTRNGHTELVPEEYEVEIPRMPRDWDFIALNFVTAITTLILLSVVAWSTSINGGLFSLIAPKGVAYLVAGSFTLAWICCMLLEWIARFDQERALIPRVGGWIALGVSMALVITEGALSDNGVVGIAGAFVELVAKGLWTVVMHFHSIKLDAKDVAFMRQRRSSTIMRLAALANERQTLRAEERMTREKALLGLEEPAIEPAPAPVIEPEPVPAIEPAPAPVIEPEQTSVSSFVRGLISNDPEISRERVFSIALPVLGYDAKTRDAVRKAYARNKPKQDS